MHFGILSSPVPGHLQPLSSIGRTLLRRGHRVTVFHVEDARRECERLGVGFCPLGLEDFPPGSWTRYWHPIAEATGAAVLWHTIRAHRLIAEVMCRHAPAAMASMGVEALLVDSLQFQGAAIAEQMGLPFISVDCTLPLTRDLTGLTPPPFINLLPSRNPLLRTVNWLGHQAVELFARPVLSVASDWRHRWTGRRYRCTEETYSKDLHLSPMPATFDFPRADLGSHFKRCGPFLDERRPEPDFPWEKLDGKPLVYASLGTLQNRIPRLYEILGAAALETKAQWVVSFGAWRGDRVDAKLPTSVIACDFAPQLSLLKRAQVCVTHAGANTTLEALAAGVPLVAIPIGNDQPAIVSAGGTRVSDLHVDRRRPAASGGHLRRCRPARQRAGGDRRPVD